MAPSPHRPPLHHPTRTRHPLRRPGRAGASRRDTSGHLARQHRCGRDHPRGRNHDDLETLDAYCTTGSQRRAAGLLHLQHSSVARRLEQIGKTLGIELADPAGLLRARIAPTAWRLLNG
ncbi:helix-turn-helix domain-containing protein [Streptomyces sp. NPDC051658]|uniref:helix-turn-helix domain-containing protein n=1 Tax=Streptomyces sp. NPDC051658 TaxID=3365667 RepID=UPI00379D638A